jgi:hypothetical protein
MRPQKGGAEKAGVGDSRPQRLMWPRNSRLGAGATRASHVNMGSLITSSPGTGSTACPAFRHARRPPAITNTLNPSSRSRCATRALVASRAQVQ